MSNEKNGSALAVAQVTGITKGAENETAISAAAAQAQAVVQARYVMAFQRPRDWDDVRVKMLKACARPLFASTAVYSKPVGGQKIEGPSIRFAEEAARSMGNVDIQTPVLYDDFEKRIVGVRVTDLESNTNYSSDVTIQKTVERKKLKDGQTARGSRMNSFGDVVYLVEATDDDLLNKQNALISKAIRTGILRILPSDIREEAIDAIYETVSKADAKDPDAARKKLADSFSAIGVSPSELKKYLSHELASCSPAELSDLRKVYTAIKEGEASWAESLKMKLAESGEKASAPAGEQNKTRSQTAKDAVRARAQESARPAEVPHDAKTGELVSAAKQEPVVEREPGVDPPDDGPVPGRAY